MEDIMEDFMLSNQYSLPANIEKIQPYIDSGQLPNPDMVMPLITQDPAYLQASFDEAISLYGSMENFALEGLGMTAAQMEVLVATLTQPQA